MEIERQNVERFDRIASGWDDDPTRVLMGQKIARAMLAVLAPDGTERALEFGAGTGLVTLLLARHVGHLTALDAASGMLAVLRAKCERKQLGMVEVLQGSVPQDLPAGPFDLIYSSMTLHHIADVPALLQALAGRVRPGGRVALADLDAEDGRFHDAGVEGVAHHGFARDTLRRWLVAAGFADVQFSTAFTAHKEHADGTLGAYPIFLAVARRQAA